MAIDEQRDRRRVDDPAWAEPDPYTAPRPLYDAQVTEEAQTPQKQGVNPEAIQKIEVDEEDRLAFRVGVNLITLALIGVGIYFLVMYLRA